MATQSNRQPPDPCAKVLAREALSLCLGPAHPTAVWLQGYVVWQSPSGASFALDDGSGVVALVESSGLGEADVGGLEQHQIALASYALVVGKAAGVPGDCEMDDVVVNPPARTDRVLITATAVRNLSSKADVALLEALWHSEVVESWLDMKEAT